MLVVGAIAVSLLFDPNDYKGYVETYVKETTGRNLELAEDLHLAYFPWLAVETGGITLGNAPGFEAEPFATIDRAAVRVRLLPLLKRKVEIGTITLDGLALNLGVDGEGHGNWEDLTGGSEPATGAAANNGASALESIDIAGLAIRNGTVAWRENTNELRYTVADLSVTTGHIAIGAPLDLAASFELTDVAAATRLRLELSGGLEIDADGAVHARDIDANFGVTDHEALERATGHLQLAALSIPADRRLQTSTAVLDDATRGPAVRVRPAGARGRMVQRRVRHHGADARHRWAQDAHERGRSRVEPQRARRAAGTDPNRNPRGRRGADRDAARLARRPSARRHRRAHTG